MHCSRSRSSSTIGVVFTSGGRRNKEIDIQIAKTNAVLREPAFEHYKAVSLSVIVPTLTYGHESWVMTERVLPQVQAAEMGFLRRVHSVTSRPVARL